MAKRRTRNSKDSAPSGITPGSNNDPFEVGDAQQLDFNRPISGGTPTRRRPKDKATQNEIKLDYPGSKLSRIDIPSPNEDKITTWSSSGIQKRRMIPDNSEDVTADTETPTIKKVRIHHHDENVDKNRAPDKGKGKITPSIKREDISPIEEDEYDYADFDEKELTIAMRRSHHDFQKHVISEQGSSQLAFKSELEDDPFINVVPTNAMPSPPPLPKKEFLEDFEQFTIKALPKSDESFFVQVQDPLLRAQYRDLPPLRLGYLYSWNTSSQDIAHIPYSQWPNRIPFMEIGKGSLLMNTIKMKKYGRFFNPSRASPQDIIVRAGYRGRREAYIGKQPAVAIITGYCTESNLIRGKNRTKSISVLFHGQEWERFCCFVTMIFDETEMTAQVYRSSLSFSTLPDTVLAPPKFPNTSLSPLSGRAAKINDTPIERARGTLYFTDVVPVYDARDVEFDIKTNLEHLQHTLPLFDGEIPVSSCVAVAHSLSSYVKKDEKSPNVNLATSLLFVIVFGTPYS